jgi:hypothetical protein
MKGSAVLSMTSAYCDIIKLEHRCEFSSLITTRISMKMVLLAVPVFGSCEYCNELSGCIKVAKFLERLLTADNDC